MLDVPRATPEPGTRPYYFTFAAILGSGVRIPQYDDRGRTWRLSATADEAFQDVVAVEVYVHPAFATGAPPVRIQNEGRFEVAYVGRKDLSLDGKSVRDYLKQKIVVTCPWSVLRLIGTPDDFDGGEPAPGWRFDVESLTEEG